MVAHASWYSHAQWGGCTIERGEGGRRRQSKEGREGMKMLYCIASYHITYIYIYIISFVDYIWHIALYHISCCTKISRVSYHFRAYHIILEHIQLYCIISCNIMPYHIMFAWYMYVSHSISNYMSLYVIVLYCIVLYCIVLSYAVTKHVMLGYCTISYH